MVTYVHNIARAKKSRNWIAETQANGAECCIALAHLGESNQPVALVMPSGLSGLTKKLKVMDFEGKPKALKAEKEKGFNIIAIGLAKLGHDNILNVRLKKGSAQSLGKGLHKYFKVGFGLEVPYDSIALEVVLPEDQENLFAQTEAANELRFSSEEGEAGNQAAPAQPAAAPVPDEPDTPDEDLMEGLGDDSDADSDVSDVESIFDPADVASDTEDEVPEPESEAAPEPRREEQAVSQELKDEIASTSATIAAHAISLSRQIGTGKKTEPGPLTAKIAAWLEDLMEGLSPAEQELALHNFTCRLLIMLSYTENLRNLQYTDDSPETDDKEDETIGEKILVNGIDLDKVSTGDLTREEVTASLFEQAKSQAKKRLLPFPLDEATPDRIANMVASGWPKEDGDAAGKRKAVQRLIAVTQQMFAKDDQLINLLGLKKTDMAEGEDLVANLVRNIRDVWEAHRTAAIRQKDEVKRRVDDVVEVRGLGGTWQYVDDIFLQIDGEISDQLDAILGQQGQARSKAIEVAKDTVQTNLGYLDGNNIVELLDDPPFEVGQGAVGETLREGLAGVSDGLKKVEAASATAMAGA